MVCAIESSQQFTFMDYRCFKSGSILSIERRKCLRECLCLTEEGLSYGVCEKVLQSNGSDL